MKSLVRARDFEIDRLTKACESELNEFLVDSEDIDNRSYNISLLNEKLRVCSSIF
jgi:hypothetical protein